jgi:DNA primase
MKYRRTNIRYLAEEVKKRLDILDVAMIEGLQFQKKGKNYFTSCPFHPDRTPSFSIVKQRQYFHCFSCGRGGDVIRLLAILRGVSDRSIIEFYAKEFGLYKKEEVSPERLRELNQRVALHGFKKNEESNSKQVTEFLLEMVSAYKKAMKQVKTLQDRDALQIHYQIYDSLPYYQYLLECMYGDYGEYPQVQAYLRSEEVMNEWNFRINS